MRWKYCNCICIEDRICDKAVIGINKDNGALLKIGLLQQTSIKKGNAQTAQRADP